MNSTIDLVEHRPVHRLIELSGEVRTRGKYCVQIIHPKHRRPRSMLLVKHKISTVIARQSEAIVVRNYRMDE